jgi:hypothetical protein
VSALSGGAFVLREGTRNEDFEGFDNAFVRAGHSRVTGMDAFLASSLVCILAEAFRSLGSSLI